MNMLFVKVMHHYLFDNGTPSLFADSRILPFLNKSYLQNL